ncbi:hypothetical protein P691DRAFT_737046 [Macrolepiota fuliginosa MF-IS2]|uniref:Wax synthase domain-containing protein n=1 Tax=Macrolepiota fuliginosa MF-IS2 TaxID=1400762 RepID=A0A9P5X641_9AGAR|nr:hypothetical protein P691DRAFT_737046 [Macrolepiota fuliginosa MF-IS2]
MKDRSPYSPLLHFLTQFLVFLTLILPASFPTTLRRLFFLPIAAIVYHIAFRSSSGDITTDVGIGPAVISQGIIALDFVLLHDPRKHLRRKPAGGNLESEGTEGDRRLADDGGPGITIRQRVDWALALLVNPRGYGWSFEPAPGVLPVRPSVEITRTRFLLGQLGKVLLCATIEVAAYILNDANPIMHLKTGIWRSDINLAWKIIAILGIAAAGYARVNMLYCLSAVATVAIGVSKPQAWPDLFGSIWEAWSVNAFWSRVWHQLIRRPLISITNTILPPTWGARGGVYDIFRLFALYFVSGVIHAAGEYMMLNAFSFESLLFFALQPIAIIFEKTVLLRLFGNPKSPNNLERILGFLYVLMWFTWTGPLFLDPMIRGGMFEDEKGTLGHTVVHSVLPRFGLDLRHQ